MSTHGLRHDEISAPGVVASLTLESIIFEGKSEFQKLSIVKTQAYGKCLFMDGQIQSAELDEFIYHESLVQPSMFLHPNPKRVFIGGGGEGATAREVLRHKEVTLCVMADLDKKATDLAEEHMPEWSQGAFKDPRFKLVNDDARKVLLSYPDGFFDVVILDLCDPLDFGPCYTLYSSEFYDDCFAKTADDGVFVTQSACSNFSRTSEVWAPVHNTLKHSRFSFVYPYSVHIPSFLDGWGFVLACKAAQASNGEGLPRAQVAQVDPKAVDEHMAKRMDTSVFKHYDGGAHRQMFTLNKWQRDAFAKESRIICEQTPIYVNHVASEIKPADRTHEPDTKKQKV
eukprot:CAMPEP_0175136084 /NCGR_PEP_ID=MMETSP0087-20121206/9080_1 /TAXON_ID=136419 /ORGANISM="Unknown Unknown, Strain D1" /LENGTH=340 /DNA_ID=CAMNT_0016418803 /DNA_START=30 /DNA_END=1052 /DNA_ORIENTATION=-